jgi:molybdopterin converting factor small subunit
MKKFLFGAIAFLFLIMPVQAAESADDLAKKTAGEFLDAFKSNKIEAAMKIAGTPFYLKNRDLIKDKAELEKHFAEEFKKNAGKVNDLSHSVKEIHSFESIKDQINEDKEKINEVLKDGDRVVLLEVKIGEKEMKVAIAVALRQGKASVVGVSKVSEN